jgi:hypothetical protein
MSWVHPKFVGQSASVVHGSGVHRWPGEQNSDGLHSASDKQPTLHSFSPVHPQNGTSQMVVGSCAAHSASVMHVVSGM